MCRPGHGPSRHPFTGGHIGPPLHNAGNVPEITESGVENEHFPNGAGRSPPPTGGAEQSGLRRGAPGVWLPPAKFRNGIWGVSHRHRPLRGDGEAAVTTWGSGAERGVCASGRKGWVGIGAEIIPKGAINVGQSLSRPDGRQLPLHKGAFGDGGCGLPRRFAPRNDSPEPLSFRGGPTGRRGNPSFLRWTGVWAAPRKTRGTARRVVVPYGKPN